MNVRPTRTGGADANGRRVSTAIVFHSPDVLGCVRVDLTSPDNGERWETGEVGRRLYYATVGIPPSAVLQLAVGPDTPHHDLQLPERMKVQVVAPDAATLRTWLAAVSGGAA